MLKKISYIIIGLILASCGASTDKKADLANLKKQREELTTLIKKLEIEVKSTAGPVKEHATMVSIKQYKSVPFKHFVEVQGVVESDNNILIPVQSPGLVRKIYVKEGVKVKKGQILAQIDSDLISRGIQELKVSLELATTVYERQERLWNQKIGSEVQYLQAKTQKESLDIKLSSLNKQLEMTKVLSPINGTVDEIIIREGEMAGAGMPAIRVVNVSDLKITADLSETYINDIQQGDMVSVSIPSIANNSVEKVMAVAKVINPKNRTFGIEIDAPSSKNIKPNMHTVLSINDYSKDNAIVVPINIMQNSGTNFFVFRAVQIDGKWYAKKTFVKPGKYYNNMIELLEGVNHGDYLITFGFQQVSDGSLLKVSK